MTNTGPADQNTSVGAAERARAWSAVEQLTQSRASFVAMGYQGHELATMDADIAAARQQFDAIGRVNVHRSSNAEIYNGTGRLSTPPLSPTACWSPRS